MFHWTSGDSQATVAAVVALAAALWWLYQRGRHQGKMTAALTENTSATKELTHVTGELRQEFSAHRARTDTLLDEHGRMLIQHDKRLSSVEQRGSVSVTVNPPPSEGSST